MLEATNITVTPETPLNPNITLHVFSAAEKRNISGIS